MQSSDDDTDSIVLVLEPVEDERLTWFGLCCSDEQRYGSYEESAPPAEDNTPQATVADPSPTNIQDNHIPPDDGRMDVDELWAAQEEFLDDFEMGFDEADSMYSDFASFPPAQIELYSAMLHSGSSHNIDSTFQSSLTPEEHQLCLDWQRIPGLEPSVPLANSEGVLRMLFKHRHIAWSPDPSIRRRALPLLRSGFEKEHQLASEIMQLLQSSQNRPAPPLPIPEVKKSEIAGAWHPSNHSATEIPGKLSVISTASKPTRPTSAKKSIKSDLKGTIIIEKTTFTTRALYTVKMSYLENTDDESDDEAAKALRMGIDTGSGLTWVTEKDFQQLGERGPLPGSPDLSYEIQPWRRVQMRRMKLDSGISWSKEVGPKLKKGQIVTASDLHRYADGSMLYTVPLDRNAGYITIGNSSTLGMNASICVLRAANERLTKDMLELDGILGLAPFTNDSEERITDPSDATSPLLTQLAHWKNVNSMELHWWQTPAIGGPHLVLGNLPSKYEHSTIEMSDWMPVGKLASDTKRSKWVLGLARVEISPPNGEITAWNAPLGDVKSGDAAFRPIIFDTGAYHTFLPEDILGLLHQPLGLIPDEGTVTSGNDVPLLVCDENEETKLNRDNTNITFHFCGNSPNAKRFSHTISGADLVDHRRVGMTDTKDGVKHPGSLLQPSERLKMGQSIWGVNFFRGLLVSFRSRGSNDVPTIRIGRVRDLDPKDLDSLS